MTKSAKYFYDASAVREPSSSATTKMPDGWDTGLGAHGSYHRDGREKGAPVKTDRYKDNPVIGRNLRDVWTIATQPYPGAHFAAFPEKLVKRCILAGTSAKGCCPECGAPWERRVERIPGYSKAGPKTQAAHEARGGVGTPIGTVGKSGGGRVDGYSTTTGWRSTCEHEGEPVPGTVLDPFGGSGTVGKVAQGLRREWIIIEINPDYCELARKRTANPQEVLRLYGI